MESWTFRANEEGLLFQTQFQQPAILLFEKAFYEAMKEKHVCSSSAFRYCGHSLGEYGAVACITTTSMSALAEVVFLRGLTMQSAVPRDALGRSRYGMVAVSPIRVGEWFVRNEQLCSNLVEAVEKQTGHLLQIVNYNVLGAQYVVAGSLTSLEALRCGLDLIKAGGEALLKSDPNLEKLVADVCAKAAAKVNSAKGTANAPLCAANRLAHQKSFLSCRWLFASCPWCSLHSSGTFCIPVLV